MAAIAINARKDKSDFSNRKAKRLFSLGTLLQSYEIRCLRWFLDENEYIFCRSSYISTSQYICLLCSQKASKE